MSFWNACWHSEYSEPDEDGEAMCLKCGAVIHAVLTRALMARTFEQIRRQGWHKMACVETDEGWCCAADCPTAIRAARRLEAP